MITRWVALGVFRAQRRFRGKALIAEYSRQRAVAVGLDLRGLTSAQRASAEAVEQGTPARARGAAAATGRGVAVP
jgi:hypothetical protein